MRVPRMFGWGSEGIDTYECPLGPLFASCASQLCLGQEVASRRGTGTQSTTVQVCGLKGVPLSESPFPHVPNEIDRLFLVSTCLAAFSFLFQTYNRTFPTLATGCHWT